NQAARRAAILPSLDEKFPRRPRAEIFFPVPPAAASEFGGAHGGSAGEAAAAQSQRRGGRWRSGLAAPHRRQRGHWQALDEPQAVEVDSRLPAWLAESRPAGRGRRIPPASIPRHRLSRLRDGDAAIGQRFRRRRQRINFPDNYFLLSTSGMGVPFWL